ncbi:MAG: right-handed parallel beta-helix repeat-containing protein [Verrucomicrobia bacterium]|nr:right-handed parallel beta-helix repeat-containing protein [Verrucomicrobiota bacterium]
MMRSDFSAGRLLLLAFVLGVGFCEGADAGAPPAPSGGGGANTYYVDFKNGVDSNDGRSQTTPWRHCPGDASAAFVSKTTILGAGDTVRFKGGVHYESTIHLNFNGAPGAPITYDGNSLADWGKGKAVIDGENINDDARRYGFQTDTSVSHVVIRNFELTRLGGVPNLQDYVTNKQQLPYSVGYGVYLRDATQVEIRDCYFHELGIWTNGPPASFRTGLGGFGIYAFGVDGLTVSNCEFTRMEKGIRISPGQYGKNKSARKVVISDCNFHHYMRWLIELSSSANNTTLDDITVSHCQFHDFTEYDRVNWKGGGSNPHTDGIILGVSNYRNRTYGVIRLHSNFFYQNATKGGGTAMIFLTGMGGNVQIYNNVFVNSLHGDGAIYVQDGPYEGVDTPINFEIYNNTFYDATYAIMLRTVTKGCDVDKGDIKILNNLFYKATPDAAFSVMIYDTKSSPKVMDYNCYFTPRADQFVMLRALPSGKGYATLAQARSDWGWEPHGILADPKFVDISSGIGMNSNLNDLHLMAGSPCMNAGTNLSHLFTVDKDNQPRSPSQGWDIGAYNVK